MANSCWLMATVDPLPLVASERVKLAELRLSLDGNVRRGRHQCQCCRQQQHRYQESIETLNIIYVQYQCY